MGVDTVKNFSKKKQMFLPNNLRDKSHNQKQDDKIYPIVSPKPASKVRNKFSKSILDQIVNGRRSRDSEMQDYKT